MDDIYHDNGAAYGRRTRYFRNASGGGVEWMYAVDHAQGDDRWYGYLATGGHETIASLISGGADLVRVGGDDDALPTDDPEKALRALWDEQNVPQERQDEILAGIVAKAQPEYVDRMMKKLFSPTYRTELTPAGEQTVIPGCERDNSQSGTKQMSLF